MPADHSTPTSARRPIILLYHCVADERLDPWNLSVTPQHFDQHLQVLRELSHPISLRQLVCEITAGTVPDGSVVVTFDDGYADNLANAQPLLQRYEIPATIFVATGQLGAAREFWWDDLERVLLHTDRLPDTLQLHVNGTTYRWELGEASQYDSGRRLVDRRWKAWEDPPSARHLIYRSLWSLLQPLEERAREAALDELISWARCNHEVRHTHRPLSRDELNTLAKNELMDVGSHTVTHPYLSAMPRGIQRYEVRQSKLVLEDILGRSITSFSYPYGNYSADVVGLVRDAEYDCACAVRNPPIAKHRDVFQLPRIPVEDWDGTEFATRLMSWQA